MDDDTKKKWYADQTLEVGEFVEQPNGSTSHPDLWVQLSNMRLSIEAKSNQNYYPMYGKTPPPSETVYIFSSKKTKYPSASLWDKSDKIWKNGRTTFTFGHQLLTDGIRQIMEDTKKKIKLEGRIMDRTIDETKNNYSSVGLISDVNIQHSGNTANYWLDNRNIEREKQVLSYNWLQPLGECDYKVKYYICKVKDIIDNQDKNTDNMYFTCTKDYDYNKGNDCMCKTHVKDFEQPDSFVNEPFSSIMDKEYMNDRKGKFYVSDKNYDVVINEPISTRSEKEIKPRTDNKKVYICYMCLMKYYKGMQKEEYLLDYIEDVILVNNIIYYKCVWKNYPGEDWRSYTELKNKYDKTAVTELEEQIKTFWKSIIKYKPNLEIEYSSKNVLIPVTEYGEEYIRKNPKASLTNKDMFKIRITNELLEEHNPQIYKVYKSLLPKPPTRTK